MRKIPYVQTSVFVDNLDPFGGNQLATFWDDTANTSLETDEMQKIALEMNFSESTFLFLPKAANCARRVRIFTPGKEIPFAGHPTLGTGFVLKYKNQIDPSSRTSILELGIGPVAIEFFKDDIVKMKQPKAKFLGEVADTTDILSAIGLHEEDLLEGHPVEIVSTGFPFLIVPLRNRQAVINASPDANAILSSTQNLATQEVLIFAPEALNKGRDVQARMFAPSVGVLEDPATGSAAGPLGAYLQKHAILKDRTPGSPILIEQGYQIRRPSLLQVQVPDLSEEIHVSGKVRLTAEGCFFLP